MRKRFEVQTQLGITPIPQLVFPKSRHELLPVLVGLQYIFVNEELNEKVFALMEKKIPTTQHGRKAMSLWQILVLGVARLALDANYDQIHDLSNNHRSLRQLLQVLDTFNVNDEDPQEDFGLQTIKDNLMLLDDATIVEINALVVASSQRMMLKKNEKIDLKADTFVVETNVHFPTDYKLLWDATRKCLDLMRFFADKHQLTGWRKIKDWYRKLKAGCRNVGQASSPKGKNREERLKTATSCYLDDARELLEKVVKSKEECIQIAFLHPELLVLIDEKLCYYIDMLTKHIDLVDRRLLKGQIIPAEEKIHSIFEPHTEWISKGKLHKSVELGHNVLVVTDQFGLIVWSKVVEKTADCNLVKWLNEKLLATYKNNEIGSISFDKGFYSKENKELLKTSIPLVVMPKKGKCNAAELLEEREKSFVGRRRAHSAVESNINELEHHSLDRCPDKGLAHFKTFVGLAVLSYNLKKLGKELIRQQKIAESSPQAPQRKAA